MTLLSSLKYFNFQDSTGLTEVLKTAVKQLGSDKDMWQKCNEMANLFLTHRQVQQCDLQGWIFLFIPSRGWLVQKYSFLLFCARILILFLFLQNYSYSLCQILLALVQRCSQRIAEKKMFSSNHEKWKTKYVSNNSCKNIHEELQKKSFKAVVQKYSHKKGR